MEELVEVHVCRRPIFVVGSPRSGIRALGRSLGEHPALWSSTEENVLYGLFGGGKLDAAYAAGASTEELVRSAGVGPNALFTSRGGGRRWIDQTPLNTLIVDLLGEMFPDAFFVHLLRDGREVVNSMINFGKASEALGISSPESLPGWARDISDAANTWRHFSYLASEFAAGSPDRSLTIRYERLVEEPEETFAELVEALELPPDPGPASFFRGERINSSFPELPEEERRSRGGFDTWGEWTLDQQLAFLEQAAYELFGFAYADEDALALSEEERYAEQVAAVVDSVAPNGAPVALVDRPRDAVRIAGREVWHFPAHPAPGYFHLNEPAALLELDALRANGARTLVLPRAALWWCDPYRLLRDRLAERLRALHSGPACLVYDLEPMLAEA